MNDHQVPRFQTVLMQGAGLALTAALAVSGCSTNSVRSSTSSEASAAVTTSSPPANASSTPSTVSAGTSAATGSETVNKVLVFLVENHSFDQMRDGMPFTFALAQRYGYATDYQAITHPSLPNYLAIVAGSTLGVADDNPPALHPLHAQSVFGQALDTGLTAKVYAEGMPGNCSTQDGGDSYAVRHNPWTYFVDERASCDEFDVAMDDFSTDAAAGQLPNVGMVIPNLCNDAHDCGLDVADAWLQAKVGESMAGPDWSSGQLAIVITADEDDRRGNNTVLTVVAQPGLDHEVVSTPLTHLSLTRFCAEVLGVAPLGGSATAPSMMTAFGL